MTVPIDKKEQSIYHTILADMHRLRSILLNLQTINLPSDERALREHFEREQNLILGKLAEWKQRRPQIYRAAHEDFQLQIRPS